MTVLPKCEAKVISPWKFGSHVPDEGSDHVHPTWNGICAQSGPPVGHIAVQLAT